MIKDNLQQIREKEAEAKKEILNFEETLKEKKNDALGEWRNRFAELKEEQERKITTIDAELREDFKKIDQELEKEYAERKSSIEKTTNERKGSFIDSSTKKILLQL